MIILLVIAVAAVAAPVTGVVLIALAIRHEDAALSLSRRPRGVGQAAARRLLGFHGDGFEMPAGGGRGGAGARRGPRAEDPFAADEVLLGSSDFPGDGDWGWRSGASGPASLAGAGGRARR
jgi:hypothetical protein